LWTETVEVYGPTSEIRIPEGPRFQFGSDIIEI